MVLLCYKILNKAGRCRSSDVRRHFYGKEDFSPRVAPLRGKSCFQSSPVRRRGCLKAGHYKEQFTEIRKVPISLLNAAPYNPRKDLQPGDPEYQKIARSIEKYGCVEPIIWNEKTGNVIGGHQRLKVLAATGAVEVDVSVVQLSLEDEKALNLALNKISGQWDNEKLSAVLQDLSAGFDVEVTGFDQHEVDALVASFAESGHEYELPGSEPYINNFFDSGVQAKPKAEEPAAAPAPEAPAQDAEMHPNAAPAPNEVQAVQPGGKKTVIVPNLSEQDASTLVDVLKDMGFAYRLEDAA